MKPFREQYIECRSKGMHSLGELKKFKDHPELLPPAWHKAAKSMLAEMKLNPDAGILPTMCGRFGGECHSGHPECKKLRKGD